MWSTKRLVSIYFCFYEKILIMKYDLLRFSMSFCELILWVYSWYIWYVPFQIFFFCVVIFYLSRISTPSQSKLWLFSNVCCVMIVFRRISNITFYVLLITFSIIFLFVLWGITISLQLILYTTFWVWILLILSLLWWKN